MTDPEAQRLAQQVRLLLRRLGPTDEAVARALRRRHARGVHGLTFFNPLALYLRRRLKQLVMVNATRTTVFRPHNQRPVRVPHPKAIRDFVETCLDGAYPDLCERVE